MSPSNHLYVKAEEEALVLYRKAIEAAGKIGDWETRELFEKIYAEKEAWGHDDSTYVRGHRPARGRALLEVR